MPRKAEAVRWQAECHRRLWEGVEVPVEDAALEPEIYDWADKLVQCFYWLDEEDSAKSTELSLLDDVGGCLRPSPKACSSWRARRVVAA